MRKKISIVLIGLTLCIGLVGCGKDSESSENKETTKAGIETTQSDAGDSETTTQDETDSQTTTVEDTTGEQDTVKKSEAAQEYLSTLDEVDANISIGTAGSGMAVIKETVSLMNLSVGTTLTEEQIKEETEYWLSTKDSDTKNAFKEKLKSVDNIYKILLTEGQEELLASAGCEDAPYPWSTEPLYPMEVLMETVGLR